jgi:hypothetical protein
MAKVTDMRGRERPEEETPEGPVAASVVYMIDTLKKVTPNFLDEAANGGPEQFQVIQMQLPGGGVMQHTLLGKTVWDSFFETALAHLVGQVDVGSGDSDEQMQGAVKLAARAADMMIVEKRRRDPQRMQVQAGSNLG